MDKYRLYCNTDSKFECVIANSTPTNCPVNAEHTFNADSIVVLKTNVLVNDGTAKELPLSDYKQLRHNEIDAKTSELISAGFTYDSTVFSLSIPAQINWLDLKTLKLLLTWPVNISTKSNEQYSLAEANLDAFAGAGLGAKQAHLDSGRALKVSVNAATNETGVDAVVDNR